MLNTIDTIDYIDIDYIDDDDDIEMDEKAEAEFNEFLNDEERARKNLEFYLAIEPNAENLIKKSNIINLEKYKNLTAMTGHNLDIIKPDEKFIFGMKIQYSSLFLLAGATSAGKTELLIDIADIHAREKDSISILIQYEGTVEQMIMRIESKKHIQNPNFFVSISPNFDEIESAINKFKDKKIFIIVDYMQMMARKLQARDVKNTDNIRFYINKIYQFFDNLRNKYENICICLLSSFSNLGMKDIKGEKHLEPLTILAGIKESGDIMYDMDYAYCLLFNDYSSFTDEDNKLGRINEQGKCRKYTILMPVKSERLGSKIERQAYIYNVESGRYDIIINKEENEKKPVMQEIKEIKKEDDDGWIDD